jgi:formiminoglutamase
LLRRKIPVVIGGGHNNAYPLLKGAAKGLQQAQQTPLPQINCINLDAHTPVTGPEEGRHSGNAFRYAESDGFLQKVLRALAYMKITCRKMYGWTW